MFTSRWLFWTSLGLTFFFGGLLTCFNNWTRRVPLNYIALMCFTICTSYTIGGITMYSNSENVLIATALTFTVFMGLTLFTFFVRKFSLLNIKFCLKFY